MKVNPVIVFREEFDGSAVLFDPDSGEAFELSPTGTVIWKALCEHKDKKAVISLLEDVCDYLPPSAGDDFDDFIGQMKSKGLIKD